MKDEILAFLSEHGFNLPLESPVGDLNSQDLVLLTILKHLFQSPRLVILDEILDKLEPKVFAKVIRLLLRMKVDEGAAIVVISHQINDLYKHADRFSIVRQGQTVLSKSVSSIDRLSLIKLAYLSTQKLSDSDTPNSDFRALLRANFYILLNLPVVLILIDHDQHILLLSDGARNYFVVAENDGGELMLEDVVHDETVYRRIRENCGADTPSQLYNIPLSNRGKKRLVDIMINPIQMDNFRVGDIVILNDITDKEFLKHQLMLKDKLSSIGLLSMGVAHEINNPLDIILKCIDLLQDGELDEEQRELVDDIETEIDTITHIIERLMSTSDTSGRAVEVFDFNGMIRTTLVQVSRLAEELDIEITATVPEEHACIEANPTQIQQVLRDLIKNSFEAIGEDGTITIATSIDHSSDPQTVEFTIRDNGAGFDGENKEDVFLPFFSTKSSAGKNLGLGLYSSYNVVKGHGGKITMEENPDRGVTFRILLPLATYGTNSEVQVG